MLGKGEQEGGMLGGLQVGLEPRRSRISIFSSSLHTSFFFKDLFIYYI